MHSAESLITVSIDMCFVRKWMWWIILSSEDRNGQDTSAGWVERWMDEGHHGKYYMEKYLEVDQ
jgi:hypothetical protein